MCNLYKIDEPNGTRQPNEMHSVLRSCCKSQATCVLTLILRRSRTGAVWFYTSTSNKRAARTKLYTKSLTRDLKLMY